MKEWLARGDTGTGAIIQLTVTTVFTVLARAPNKWETELLYVNKGTPEWAVAAIIVGMNSMHGQVRDYLIESGMHYTPLSKWRDVYKGWANAVRRCPILEGAPDASFEDVLIIRKIFNCTYRSKEEADWEAEKRRRIYDMPVHFGLNGDGLLSRSAWEKDLVKTVQQLAFEIVGEVIAQARLDNMQDWWNARWAWCPNGSSSLRAATNDVKAADDRLGTGARPSKKAVFEELPDNFASVMLTAYPYQYVARASTKPEPGGKARALYAVGDPEFVISGYASVHIEKHMNIWGIKAKQTPADVVHWAATHMTAAARTRWLSLDYSDYNTEHEASTLRLLNTVLAAAWKTLGAGKDYVHDKVKCAAWAGRAHCNKWVSHDGEMWRAYSGLYSGDRDTARDNTLLHGVYSRMALQYTKLFDAKAAFHDANYTGDDEDSLMTDWVSCLNYMLVHRLMNFVLKPEKQMCSSEVHEFLQRMTTSIGLPTRPIFATLAQFASGNWYTDVYAWYDTTVQAVSDNVWEMVTRGMPIQMARRLAVETINASMRVPTDDGWRRLEWWSFRHGSVNQHPLWVGTRGPRGVQPTLQAKPVPATAAKGQATKAWIAIKKRDLPVQDEKGWRLYSQHCLKEGYASLYVKERAFQHKRFALEEWPERINTPQDLDAPAPPRFSPEQVAAMVRSNPVDRRPAKMDEVLARMGLDAPMVNALGGLTRVLGHMHPSIMQYYSSPEAEGYVPVPMQWEDGALRSWYGASAIGKVDAYKRYNTMLQRAFPLLDFGGCSTVDPVDGRQIKTIFMAPNAGGKTTFCEANKWCVDMDQVISKLHLTPKVKVTAKLGGMPKDRVVTMALEDVLMRQGRTALATQMELTDFLEPYCRRGFKVQLVLINVQRDRLLERMASRGWDYDKSMRRIMRWQGAVQRVLDNTAVLSKEERHRLVVLEDWPSPGSTFTTQ